MSSTSARPGFPWPLFGAALLLGSALFGLGGLASAQDVSLSNVQAFRNDTVLQEDTPLSDLVLFSLTDLDTSAFGDQKFFVSYMLRVTDGGPSGSPLTGAGTVATRIECEGDGFSKSDARESELDRNGSLIVKFRVNQACTVVDLDNEVTGGGMIVPKGGHLLEEIVLSGIPQAARCRASESVLCLQDGRFRVTVRFQQGTDRNRASALPRDADSGTFRFFDGNDSELLVRVVNGCDTNDRFWVFVAGLADVEAVLKVRDTQARKTSRYSNSSGAPFQPILDTDAFATCP